MKAFSGLGGGGSGSTFSDYLYNIARYSLFNSYVNIYSINGMKSSQI